MALTKISTLDKFLTQAGDTFIVNTKSIKVFVPTIYKDRGLMTIEDHVSSVGIVKVVINDTYFVVLMMTTMLSFQPSSISEIKEDDYPYTVLEFVKGDKFITSRSLVKNSKTIFDLFVSFVDLGKIPPFLEYTTIHHLFDFAGKLNGLNFAINHSTYEVLFSHMYRDAKDPFTFYRLTPMKLPPIVSSLNQVSHGPTSATARTIGSYMNDGMISTLVHDNEDPSAIENILRA